MYNICIQYRVVMILNTGREEIHKHTHLIKFGGNILFHYSGTNF